MTTSTTQDYSDNMEKVAARKLLCQLREYLDRGLYYRITEQHLDALKFYRNEMIQEVLKYADGGKS